MPTARTFSFIIPDAPHPCQRAAPMWKQKRLVDTQKNRSAKKFIAKCVNERVEELGGFEPFEGAVRVGVKYLLKKSKGSKLDMPTNKSDIDNFIKTTLDGITRANGLDSGEKKTVIWEDDGCVVEIDAQKMWANEGIEPHTEVWIEEVL